MSSKHPIAFVAWRLICVLPLLLVAACTDARGFNAFEAYCVDREHVRTGTAELDDCVQRERRQFELEMRARNRIGGTL